jgi:cytochrome b6-f complex iron-sulfur subunit
LVQTEKLPFVSFALRTRYTRNILPIVRFLAKTIMDRRKFLSSIGVGAAFALTASCLGSCKKNNGTTAVDFTIDITDSTYSSLKNNGGYVIKDQVVIARTTSGDYAAATVTCSHEGRQQVTYDKSANQWYCTAHGARFGMDGSGANGNGSKGLTIYKTTLSGNSLRVYSA